MPTYVATRRDGSVSQEAYYSILGLLPGGKREVLSVVHHPEEGALCWEMELEALKGRGVESVWMPLSQTGFLASRMPLKRHFLVQCINFVQCISSEMHWG
jgi:transposase, mutator family